MSQFEGTGMNELIFGRTSLYLVQEDVASFSTEDLLFVNFQDLIEP